jgi:flagellar biosynthesis protein FlhF
MAVIKSYFAETKKEAFDKVKLDLGCDAVIISTRKIRRKGFANIFKKPAFEVTAVSDSDTPQKRADKPQAAPERDRRIETLEKKITQVSDTVGKIYQNIDWLKLKQITEADPRIQKLYDTLVGNGISPDGADKLTGMVLETAAGDEDLTEAMTRVIVGVLGEPSPISLNPGKRKVVLFAGPTGVGKTTTLAKIAAGFALKQNIKIAIITEDTYRIGAVEQLRIYADILGLPMHVVYSPEEFLKKIEETSDFDLVLVDTAGKNTDDTEYRKTIRSMVKCPADIEVHLVISAATSAANTVKIIDSYSYLNDYKILFTKLDEAKSPGLIPETKLFASKPLSYVTYGQNAASDISEANPAEIAKTVLGLT